MALVLNGSGSITGLSAGGLPDGSVTADDIASTLDLSGKTITNMNPSGIYLGGTGAANYLDDYETGTFTPTLKGNSITYSHQNGTYTKIGNMVAFQLSVKVTAITAVSSYVIVEGLPFTSINHGGGNPYTPVSTQTNGFDWTGSTNTMITFQVAPGSTHLQATTSGDNTSFADVNASGLAANDWIQVAGVYFAAS